MGSDWKPPSPSPRRFRDRRRLLRRQRDHRLVQRERELEAARLICQALSQHVNMDDLVESALRIALEVVEADAGSVLLADDKSKQLIFRFVIGEKAEQLRGTAIPWDKGVAGAVFQSGEPAIISDVARDTRHFTGVDHSTGFKTRDMITIPLKRWEGVPIGVLQVLNKREGQLNKDDIAILTIISALASQAIEQARLFETAKLAEVARLIGDIGHDIKNLLTPVVTGGEFLQTELNKLFSSLSASGISGTQTNQDLCNRVIGLLRNAARRIQDRVKEIGDCVKGLSTPPRFAPCLVGHVVGDVIKTLCMLADEKNISLRAEGLDLLPPITADERRLFNAFYNLIHNAISVVPGGGFVTVSGQVELQTGLLLLSICDNGRGMPPEIRDSLFTSRAISHKMGGTGLGTKIVKDVVDAHGGQITVESKEGVGTTIHICLPMQQPSATGTPAR
ncbi:MAG TPA: GAF domain-containing sensor histidine kinase [Nitrospirales bacterium]|nr:GAF domain-containing sensor histidine kinase [Nitrospirales bacterium]